MLVLAVHGLFRALNEAEKTHTVKAARRGTRKSRIRPSSDRWLHGCSLTVLLTGLASQSGDAYPSSEYARIGTGKGRCKECPALLVVVPLSKKSQSQDTPHFVPALTPAL